MKTMTRLLMIACLVLPFAACKKHEAPAPVVKAPMSAPKTDDRQAWVDYLNDVVPRHMAGIPNQPYVYLLPGEGTPDFQDQYDRMLEKAQGDVARGIIAGNMLAYASPASARMGDLVIAAFKGVPADSMKGVRVLFIGKAADSDRVKAAVSPAGVEYVFVDTAK
jgi:hypothetical protein